MIGRTSKKILMLVAVLLAGAFVKNVIDLFWHFSGLDTKGLSSLISLLTMAFLTTFLIPLKTRVKNIFKEALVFSSIWLAFSFSVALMRNPSYIQIGFLIAVPYASFRLGVFPKVGKIRPRILCEEQPSELRGHALFLSVAPIPKTIFLHGFSLKSIILVLKRKARFCLRLPEDIFMNSFEHHQMLELRGSLSNFVEIVRENLEDGSAVLCEARFHKGSFRMRVEISSDSLHDLRRLAESLNELNPSPDWDIERTLEAWRLLKPCAKPIPGTSGFPNAGILAGRLLIVGDNGNAEKLALKICLSQLRKNSMVLVMDGKGRDGDGPWEEVEGLLTENGFRPEKSVKTYRGRCGTEVVFADDLSNKALLKKISSKPIVAVWFRDRVEDLVDAPIEVLTSKRPYTHTNFEANSMILVNCERSLIESFLPLRQGFVLEGKTILISQKGVRCWNGVYT